MQNFDPDNCQIWTAPGFVATAAYFPERYAELIIPAAIRLANGEEVPPQLLVPHVAITPQNIREVYPEVACP